MMLQTISPKKYCIHMPVISVHRKRQKKPAIKIAGSKVLYFIIVLLNNKISGYSTQST